MNLSLQTKRLLLKTLTAADAPEVLAYIQKNRTFLEPWEMKRHSAYYTLEFQSRVLEEEASKAETGQMLRFWIYTADENSRIIGSAALSNIVRGPFLSCNLGYKLDEEEQNKGYMTEAVRAVIQYAFQELGLHRIEANVMPRNSASLGVLHKLGFYNEGLAYKYLKLNGVWEDHIHMVLRNEAMEEN